MPVCDVCDQPMEWGQGYGLTTGQVATAEAYWMFMFSHQWSKIHTLDPTGANIAMLVTRQAGQKSAWLVCDACGEMFAFDRDVGRSYNGKGVAPPDTGPANVNTVALAAAFAWSRLYEAWPEGVQMRAEPLPADGSSCDFCRRRVYGDEELAFMNESVAQDFASDGLILKREGPSRNLLGEAFWACCPFCVLRAKRISEGPKTPYLAPAPRQIESRSSRRRWWQFWRS